jgi:feruloyl-CoA synthase
MAFGAMRAGVPFAAADPAAARAENARSLTAIAELVRPSVVFAHDDACAPAVRAAAPDAAFVCVAEARGAAPCVDYVRVTRHAPLGGDVEPPSGETVAKIVIVRRDDEPAGVVTTHGMLCAMVESVVQRWPVLETHPSMVADAAPWHRGFGGNVVLGLVLRTRGTLALERGGADAAPTLAFDVPSGWARWVELLRGDDALRLRWLATIERACWFGAPLRPAARDALLALGVPLAGMWGAAETTSLAAVADDPNPRHDAIGVPLPGIELKLVRDGDRFEARVRGPHVTPGYWWRPDLTARAFDDEGFFRTGDLVRPIDGRAPRRGLVLAGRNDDRFTLATGTWVDRARLRAAFLAECSDAAGALVTGEGREECGLVVWPNAEGARLDRDVLRAQVHAAMHRMRGMHAAPQRALVVDRAPSERERAALTARLHASEPDAEVIVAS